MDLRRGVGEPVTSDPTGLYGSLPRFLDGSRTGGMMEKQADRSMHPYLASSVIIIRGRRAKLAPVAGTGTHACICLYRTTHDAALIHRWGRRRGTRAAKLVNAARAVRVRCRPIPERCRCCSPARAAATWLVVLDPAEALSGQRSAAGVLRAMDALAIVR
jgi:hypothetical protein